MIDAELVALDERVARKIHLSPGRFVIGRSSGCDLQSMSCFVSRRHCELVIAEDEIRVHDLGSTNGTFLNDRRIEEDSVVRDGDILRIGPNEAFVINAHTLEEACNPGEDQVSEWLEDGGAEDEGPRSHDSTIVGKGRQTGRPPA